MVVKYKKRQNFYEKKFMERYGILDICIKNIHLFFKIPIPTLNQLFIESGFNYLKIYKFIYYLEIWRKDRMLLSPSIRLNYFLQFKSGDTNFFPLYLI